MFPECLSPCTDAPPSSSHSESSRLLKGLPDIQIVTACFIWIYVMLENKLRLLL